MAASTATEGMAVATEPAGHDAARLGGPPGAPRRRRSRFRERSLLLNPASVVGAALATFLVVLVALTARLATGRDPAATTAMAIRQPSGHGAGTALTTRSSGGQALGPSPQSAQGVAAATQGGSAPLVTSASGAGGLYVEGDDGA